ncbi:putative methyltransferase [Oxalobacteraceae bacterium GrIS 1.18]
MYSFLEKPRQTLFLVSSIVIAMLVAFSPARAVEVSQLNVIETGRPAEDFARDQERKPADMLVFAQIKPGQTVVDYIPGRGYFTRLFSNAVGVQGTVYSVVPQFLIEKFKDRPRPPSVSLETGHANVHDAISDGTTLNVPAKVDLVWTSQNYHDVHNGAGPKVTADMNKAVFDALRPGGLYIVLDHAAGAGQDDTTMTRLHRIDRAIVIKEVTAAGFILDGESTVLNNPADPHDAAVFDPSIRGKTDQFILRFKKPLK